MARGQGQIQDIQMKCFDFATGTCLTQQQMLKVRMFICHFDIASEPLGFMTSEVVVCSNFKKLWIL